MKLGTQTGSLVNHVISLVKSPRPEVGMGATLLMWTDRKAYTVIGVSPSGKTLLAQRDKAIRTDSNGMSEAQSYRFEPDPAAEKETYTLRANGEWHRVGESSKGATLVLGHRAAYHDFSF